MTVRTNRDVKTQIFFKTRVFDEQSIFFKMQ